MKVNTRSVTIGLILCWRFSVNSEVTSQTIERAAIGCLKNKAAFLKRVRTQESKEVRIG